MDSRSVRPPLRTHAVHLPSVINIELPSTPPPRGSAALPPKPPAPAKAPIKAGARESLLLGRWRRRTQQRLLQSRAARVGGLLRTREAWQAWRAWRALTLGRFHKRISAELHRWSVLMRLVLRAWRALQGLHRDAQQRGAAAHAHQARQVCGRCVHGWRTLVARRQRKRAALCHYALTLSARCLLQWAVWLASQRRKRPHRAAQARLCAQASLRRAMGEWEASSAARRSAAARRRRAAEAWARMAAVAAIARWRERRAGFARGAVRTRRAYVFMASQLLGKVCHEWRGLCLGRAALDAAVPRAALRLLLLRREQLLRRWGAAGAARRGARLRAHAAREAAARLWRRRAVGRWRALREGARRREVQAAAAAALGRARVLRAPWSGWRAAFGARRAAREAAAALGRALRLWRARHRARALYAIDARAAASLWRASLGVRVLRAWRIGELEARKTLARHCRGALRDWHAASARRRRAAAAPPTARARALRAAVARWRELTVEEEARELAWRAAVRHRYRALLGAALTRGWRRYVVARRARRDERAAAQRAGLLARRGALLARWRDAAALRALSAEQLVAADAVAMGAGKRRVLPRWAAAAVARREVRHACGMAAARARRGLCARVLAAWLGYACRRASKHDMQVTRLLALRRTLDGALRARVLGAWTALHRAKAARRALFACHAAALRGRRAQLALAALEAHTVRRRVRLQQLRTAADAAARAAARRALGAWRSRAAVWAHEAAEAARADALREAALRRLMWCGWARYHLKKRHKAAVLRQAAEAHQRRLRQAGCAQWLQVGLARHELKLDAAAQHAAARAADALRRAERFARHWRALALRRRLLGGGGGAAGAAASPHYGSVPPVPQHGASGAPLWPAGRAGALHGARGWDPLALAAAQAAGLPVAETAARAGGGGWASDGGGATTSPVRCGGAAGASGAASWEALLPPPRARTAPRPLPDWDAPSTPPTPAVPLVAAAPSVAAPSVAMAPPTRAVPPVAAAPPRHPLPARQPPAWQPPPPLPAEEPRQPQSPPAAAPLPPSPPPRRLRPQATPQPKAAAATLYRSPCTEVARRAPAASPGARGEIDDIREQLFQFAGEREAWLANKKLVAQLQEQAAALAPHEQAAVHEAVRALQSKVDAYAAAQAEQQQVVARLASRIEELRV